MKTILRFFAFRKTKAVRVACMACAVLALLPGCVSRSQFQKGYERGAADTVKRQYWILQNAQKREQGAQTKPRLALYRVPITPSPDATVKTVPYEITIPIYE